jgi:hypothetical protein
MVGEMHGLRHADEKRREKIFRGVAVDGDEQESKAKLSYSPLVSASKASLWAEVICVVIVVAP